ncbi:MAG: class I SAM-dependent methyltransferase [Marinicaulis sp.]|nr:class I SAM-dependent methyltransferase [Marinicaulis sp.]NNL90513.1 class I SAM-dependent methyltransferase [Marinicaulis sp.]
MPGVDMNLEGQRTVAAEFSKSYFLEYVKLVEEDRNTHLEQSYARGKTFGGSDGALLYSMIRAHKPSKVIEIGCGQSTVLSAVAAERNATDGAPCAITAIEPYPSDYLLSSVGGNVEILRRRVEEVPLSLFESLEPSDILFIDSSHTVKVGGDVIQEINEILPRLAPNVHIHIHDICFPFNYSRQAVFHDHKFWAEQYLLQAFLAYNENFKVKWCFSYVQHHAPDILKEYFPFYAPKHRDHMGSFWMEKIK